MFTCSWMQRHRVALFKSLMDSLELGQFTSSLISLWQLVFFCKLYAGKATTLKQGLMIGCEEYYLTKLLQFRRKNIVTATKS